MAETTERLVKILGPDRMPMHGGSGHCPEPGEWREVDGPLKVYICLLPMLPLLLHFPPREEQPS